jgi:hypothetical protein
MDWIAVSQSLSSRRWLFGLRKYFMSAANRSCPAFLMASDRIDPGGNRFACARASDARAAQS